MRRRTTFLAAALAVPFLLPDATPVDMELTAAEPSVMSVDATPAEAAEAPTSSVLLDPALLPARAGMPIPVHAPFAVTVDDRTVRLGLHAVTLLPGQSVRIASAEGGRSLRHQAGTVRILGDAAWQWTAPDAPGVYALSVEGDGEALAITALVMHPATSVRSERLNGYRIGRYETKPLRGDPTYLPPEGFVEVRDVDADVLVSPRLTLGQFLCKQPGDPRYVVVSAPLIAKLEAIADHLEVRGVDPSAIAVMSGFRTPAYNRAIGNTTSYSRHLWGDAADIYIDADGNGDMDDLNGDGRSDTADARVLARWVEDVVAHEDVVPGGLSVYRRNAAHGPFVHVDARGTAARW